MPQNHHPTMEPQPLSADVLPRGVRSRFVEGVNGLTMHLKVGGQGMFHFMSLAATSEGTISATSRSAIRYDSHGSP